MNTTPRRTSNSSINLPIHFESGSFAGQTLRAQLAEIQKADLGRKYARVDRRPLDPPPVVLLKFFRVFHRGTEAQYEREIEDYSEVNTLGLLCNVDLFPVPSTTNPAAAAAASASTSTPDPSGSCTMQGQTTSSPPTSWHHNPPEPPPRVLTAATAPLYHHHHPPSNLAAIQLPPLTLPTTRAALPPPLPPPSHPHQQQMSSSSHAGQRVLTYFCDQPITEDMNCTTALSGATFIQPAVIEYKGRKALVFPFADLAVKTEGQFFLRYRCFDIFSRTSGHGDLPIQAECFGGAFRIYSTKEFPGLQPSTELTKQLARWGVRLNTRETERKRKRKEDERSSSSVARSTKGRTGRSSDSEDS